MPLDIAMRLSLVEGFTARDLRRLPAAHDARLPGADDTADGPPGRTRRAVAALTSDEAGARVARIREACRQGGIRIVPLGSTKYPVLLRDIPEAPLVLYIAGEAALSPDSVAIVGSRAPTASARTFARELAADLALSGITVVSGMARGIDAAAHEGALEGGGVTVAVLGCGVDVLYPPESGRLRDAIRRRGALVSEYPPGTPPLPRHFPARNRIISGMSRIAVVAEAPARSGALITARMALEQGREVMAVPGNPLFPHTAGSNRLLQEGAWPLVGAGDVLAALGSVGTESKGGIESKIMQLLVKKRHVHNMVRATGIPIPELLPRLLDMELRRLIRRLPGDYYERLSPTGENAPDRTPEG